jgi:hypothetical protein
LAKSPNERFGSAREFAVALAKCASADQWTSQQSDEWWKQLAAATLVVADRSPTAGISEAATVLLAELSHPK